MHKRTPVAILVSLAILFTPFMPWGPASSNAASKQGEDRLDSLVLPEASIVYIEDGKTACREATPEEASFIMQRDPDLSLHEIDRDSGEIGAQANGLHVILRGTRQLDDFPQAKQAFLKVVATWDSLIITPITIVVDVDFGPTAFGKPFQAHEVGATGFQNIANRTPYSGVRGKLIAGASSPEEKAIYEALSVESAPTELGDTVNVFGPATLFRALGILSAIADPEAEKQSLPPPPSIGFNSAASFDFDPSDGIDGDKVDFQGLALHEMGHVLGFFSAAGNREVHPSAPVFVSVWDLFRFRPGVTMDSFSSDPRALRSGGEHVFFAGGPELNLSTGREDYTGGDGQQSHHWKANELSGRYIGIMDPTFGKGERTVITENDLAALDTMGYQIARAGAAPVISALSASLEGDVLTLDVNAGDPQGDIALAQVKLLDGIGQVVAQTSRFEVNVGTSPQVSFRLTVTNLNTFPTVKHAALFLTDRQGQTSQPAVADFSQADPGGPTLQAVTFGGTKLKIKGRGLSGDLQIEINGVIVATGTNTFIKKVIVKGNSASLNLRNGFNRIRVRNGTLWSNIWIAGL